MTQKWLIRIAVAGFLGLALLLGWQQVRPPERTGDVPFVSTRPQVVDRMLTLADLGADDLLIDLGSGDGRIVIAAAEQFGARGRGVELDPLLITESRAAAVSRGVDARVEFVEGDLFEARIDDADALTLFLLPTVNLELRPRLLMELAPGTPVVSHMWDMAEWRPDVTEHVDLDPPAELYKWVVPESWGGAWDLEVDVASGRASPGQEGTLRLLQRFQDLEGEFVHGDSVVPVSGTVSGATARLVFGGEHAELGRLELEGTVAGGRLELRGRRLDARGERQPEIALEASGARRAARVEGVWEVLSRTHRPGTPMWELTLQPDGALWAGSVRAAPRVAAEGREPSPPAFSGTAAEMTVEEVYVWGTAVAFVMPSADGRMIRTLWYGLVEGDQMTGFVQGGGELVPFTAARKVASR